VTVIVRKAQLSDARPLAVALARAFEDDPVITWLLPGHRARHRRLAGLFELELRLLHLPLQEAYTTADMSGAALWAPPGRWPTPPIRLVRAAPRLAWTLRSRLRRAVLSVAALERIHPPESHWYLTIVGTDPDRQGRGIGSALLAPVLQRCDGDGTPAYLESSKESNVGFYRRLGFEVLDTVELPGGGPPVWPMWREPQA
jgi:ribosomal protein S18 acetylase RimI-like enzyme